MEKEEMTQNEAAEPQKEESEGVALYELSFHLLPSLTDNEVAEETAALRAAIEEQGASVVAKEDPHLVDLAYPVAKATAGAKEFHTKAHFGWFVFNVVSEKVETIQRAVKEHTNVLRFLLIHTTKESLSKPRPFVAVREGEAVPLRTPEKVDSAAQKPVSEEELDRTIADLVKE